jgi:hypothetical protein
MNSEEESANSTSSTAPLQRESQGRIAAFPCRVHSSLAAQRHGNAASLRDDFTRQAVVVLGMHRSGTSAVAEALSFLGGRLPTRLMPAQPDNPRGFFEPMHIVEIHDQILASAGTSWSHWDAFPASWYETLEAREYVRQLSDAVESDYGDAPILILKDPRICRLLPLWTTVLRELEAQLLVVLPFRNPLEVADSLCRRNAFSLGHAFLLWLRHVLDAEFASRNFPRTFLNYENFVTAGRQEIDRLEAQIPVIWPRKSARAYHQLEEAIENELRHNVATADDLVSRRDVSGWVRDTYEGYERLRLNPLDMQAQRTLDRIRSEFNNACHAFDPLFQGLHSQVEELTHESSHAAEFQAAALRLPIVELTLHEAQRENEELRTRMARLQDEVAAADRDNEELSKLAAAAHVELTAAKVGLTAAKVELTAAKQEQENLAGAIQSALGELQVATGILENRTSELERCRERVERFENAIIKQRTVRVSTLFGRAWAHVYWALTLQVSGRLRFERRLAQRAQIVLRSKLFDSDWYLKNNPDVWLSGVDPLRHYCEWGFQEKRRPGRDLGDSKVDALVCELQDV